MRSKIVLLLIFSLFFTLTSINNLSPAAHAQEQNLKERLGRIVVNPGGLQRLGVTDFLLRSGASDADVNTFNEVLLNDLKFAGVIDIVGKSLYPKKGLGSP